MKKLVFVLILEQGIAAFVAKEKNETRNREGEVGVNRKDEG
jgi:hypothetical protein